MSRKRFEAEQIQLEFCERGKMLTPEARARVLRGFRDMVDLGLVRPLHPVQEVIHDDARVLSKLPDNATK